MRCPGAKLFSIDRESREQALRKICFTEIPTIVEVYERIGQQNTNDSSPFNQGASFLGPFVQFISVVGVFDVSPVTVIAPFERLESSLEEYDAIKVLKPYGIFVLSKHDRVLLRLDGTLGDL